MAEVVFSAILAVAILVIFIFLYSQGYMVFKSINAVTFVGSAKGNSAKFSGCSGWMKRVTKFRETCTYTFVLDAELRKGDMSVELFDSAKQKILHLNPSHPRASVTVDKNEKYHLVINFSSATGRYALIRE